MTTSSRAIAALTAVLAALALTLFGTAAASANPAPAVPPVVFLAPQLTLTVSHPLIEPNGPQGYTIQAHYVSGTALVGTITLTRDLHDGSPVQKIYSTTSLTDFTGAGAGDPIFFAPVGDETWTAVFTPSSSGALGATSSASFQVRFAGATATVHTGSAVAGTPTSVTTTISVPGADAGHPIDGRVSLQVDALGEQASCLPTSLTATTASCSTTLPASLAAGTHSLTASWSTSPSFQSASVSTPLTISAPKKTGGSSTPLPSATPTASPTSTASDATPAALPAGTDPTPVAQGATSTASDSAGAPPWLTITLAILVVAALGVAALITVGIVRSRRARASA